MIDRLRLYVTEENATLQYEKYMLSLMIKCVDNIISRVNERCDLYKENHQGSDCVGKKEAVNIDYNTQLQNILDDFLMSNQVPFEKFEVQCGNLVEKAFESQQKLVDMEIECQAIVVDDDMLSFRNFYVIFITVRVHKATYAVRKARKLKKIAKKEIVT